MPGIDPTQSLVMSGSTHEVAAASHTAVVAAASHAAVLGDGRHTMGRFDKPFDRLTALRDIEGLTTPRTVRLGRAPRFPSGP